MCTIFVIACNNVSVTTYEALKALVLAGGIEHDKRVSETELATTLGVSRTPVREALQRLEGDGLVIAQGRGVRVRVMNADEMADLLTARAGLEGWAAQLAAEQVGKGLVAPATLTKLDRLANEADSLSRLGDATGGAEANRQFHTELTTLAESPSITRTLEDWWNLVTVSTGATIRTKARVTTVDNEHRTLLEAVKAGDGIAARTAAETHIIATRDALLKLNQ